MWDKEYTEVRIQEAMDTLRAQPSRGCFPAKHRSNLPTPIQNYWEVWGGLEFWEQKERLKDFNKALRRPAAKSITEMDEVIFSLMECFIDPHDRVVLTARNTMKSNGDPTSWRSVGAAVNFRWSHTWIRDSIYPQALDRFASYMRKKTLQNTPENAIEYARM